MSAGAFALGAGARFFARAIDTQQKQLSAVLKRAQMHRGASFVEIFQNCIVYNDEVFADFTDREVAGSAQLHLEHGQPMIFGKDGDRGLRVKPGTLDLEAVRLGEDGIGESDILVHDETNRTLAGLLASLQPPDMPVALGVLYCEPAPTYDAQLHARASKARDSKSDLNALLRGGHTWTVD